MFNSLQQKKADKDLPFSIIASELGFPFFLFLFQLFYFLIK